MPTITRDEETWLTYDDPAHLFHLFNLLNHPRKARMWFVACCRSACECRSVRRDSLG